MIEIRNLKQVSGPEKVWSLVLGLWSFEHLNPSTHSTTPSTTHLGHKLRATANSGQAFLLRTGFDIVSSVLRSPDFIGTEDEDFDIRNSDLWLFTIRMCEAQVMYEE